VLRFYVWDRVVALASDALGAPGHAFALAESRDQAIELIVNDCRRKGARDADTVSTTSWTDAQLSEYAPHSLEALKRELMREEPVIYEQPVGFAQWGAQ
jgi:hypothetical protein